MGFYITVKSGWRNYRLLVEHVPVNARTERYKVIGRNKTIILECNRPLFRNKGLKHRKPDWKLIEGDTIFSNGLEQIIDRIMEVVDKPG